MANKHVNMFNMPWVEWRNLAGLADPYAILSAEQGVPRLSGDLTEGRETSRSYAPKPGTRAHAQMTPKQQRLASVVRAARKAKKTRGTGDILVKYAQTAQAEKKVTLSACREVLADFIGADYHELFAEFAEAGGDSIAEFHECLDSAHAAVEEDIVEEVLWEEFLVQKGLTLEAFHQLMDAAIQTEDEEEMTSLLALEGLFEAEKKGLTGGGETKSGGVSMKGFKSLVGRHPAVSGGGGGTIDWGKYGGKKKFKSVGASPGQTNEDILCEDEEDLWEEFLCERGITVGQFHQLMDEAIASGDADEMGTLVQLDEIFGAWKTRKKAASAERHQKVGTAWAKAKATRAKFGVEKTKAASKVGQQVGQEKPVKSWIVGGGTSSAK